MRDSNYFKKARIMRRPLASGRRGIDRLRREDISYYKGYRAGLAGLQKDSCPFRREGKIIVPWVWDLWWREGYTTGSIDRNAEPFEILGTPAVVLDGISFSPKYRDIEARCIGCGCTDGRACDGGCYWVRLDRSREIGVCSCCGHLAAQWDGEVRQRQLRIIEREARDEYEQRKHHG